MKLCNMKSSSSLATFLILATEALSFRFNYYAPFIPYQYHHLSSRRKSTSSLQLTPIDMTNPAVVEINLQTVRDIDNPLLSSSSPQTIQTSIKDWIQSSSSLTLAAATTAAPTEEEVKLLSEALSTFYNEKDYKKAEMLLGDSIKAWQRQSSDEKAALYRIRGDCYMQLDAIDANAAIQDYTESITLLQTPESQKSADPNELPTSYLGRGRAIRSLPKKEQTSKLLQTAINDYEKYLILTARDSQYMDNDNERMEDGILRNPYAAWEYAATLRSNKDYNKASFIREQASEAFEYIGDTAHSVISYLDYGIDLAMSYSTSTNSNAAVPLDKVTNVLTKGIESTTKVEGRDVTLLQHVVSKEGEARLALASILWNEKNMPVDKAENVLGDACIRLEQLEQDNNDRSAIKNNKKQEQQPMQSNISNKVLKFSIDGSNSVLDAGEISCSKFKSEKFIEDVLGWPEELKDKVKKLETLKR